MTRLVVYLIGLLVSIVAMANSDPGGVAFTLSSGLAIGFAIPLLDTLIVHSQLLKIICYSVRTWRTRVRISASYLYRIHVDGEYLLVKGKRFDQYQPVGGVYKAHVSSSGDRKSMKILGDDLLLPDTVSEGDLRVRIPGKNLVAFVRWFESERGRETDGWREFYEELVATGLLSPKVFRFIKYDRIERIYRPMRYSPQAKSQELLIADILEIIPTSEQLEQLRQLKKSSDARILWATEDQIRRLGAANGSVAQTTQIAQTAEWTIDAGA
ncbi:hypothetical protein AB4Y63_05490 [Leifsonia sp. YAF41]|uniref:SMODS-associated NUDIX domain-containing protein n=1 Tax=Leifsonia sp. YAF41 TaxID=3233086 RepID=UPI003F96B48B